MKKKTILTLVVLFVCAFVKNGVMEVEWDKLNRHSTEFGDPIEIDIGKAYYSEESNGAKDWWYAFTADESGEYGLYVNNLTTRQGIEFFLYDEYEEELEAMKRVEEGEKAQFYMMLDKGKEYRLKLSLQYMTGYSYDGKFKFSICSPTVHGGLGERETIYAPTCETEGVTAQVCTFCGKAGNEEVVSSIGHTMGEMHTMRQATCMQEGTEVIQCTVCNEILQTQVIPVTNHTLDSWLTVKEATCFANGLRKQVCKICGETLKTEEVKTFGHTLGKWMEVKPATCLFDGMRALRCERCGETLDNEVVAAFGHSMGEWTETRATCTSEGRRVRSCIICGAELELEISEATGHEYSDWEMVKTATMNTEGEEMRHCIHCGETVTRITEKLGLIEGLFGR